MKKLFLTVTALFVTLILVGCGDNLDAFEILERSQAAQLEANAVSMTGAIELEMIMDMGLMTLTLPMTMDLQMENEGRMRMGMEMSIPGSDEINSVVYLRDGFQYTEVWEFGQVHHTRESTDMLTNDEMIEFFELTDMMAVAEDMVESASAESLDDGGYRLELVYNLDGIMAFFENGFDMPGMDDFADMMDVADLDGDGFSMITTIYIDENYLPSSFVSDIMMTIAMEEDGIMIEMVMEMTMTIILEDVTINFPAWLDELDPTINSSELIGTWEWDLGGFIYIFNADGTGERGFSDIELINFDWEIVNDYHLYIDLGGGMLERWSLVLVDNMITITDLDESSTAAFNYIRIDDFVEMESLEEPTT